MALHHDQEVITPPAQSGPSRHAVLETLQHRHGARVPQRERFHVGRRGEQSQAAQGAECEARALEGRPKLGGTVVRGPDGAAVQRDRDGPIGCAPPRLAPLSFHGEEGELPRTDTADDRRDQHAPGPQAAADRRGSDGKVVHAIQRAEVGVGGVEVVDRQPIELVDAKVVYRQRPLEAGSGGAVLGPPHHLRRPVDGRDAVALLGKRRGIETGAAAQV